MVWTLEDKIVMQEYSEKEGCLGVAQLGLVLKKTSASQWP